MMRNLITAMMLAVVTGQIARGDSMFTVDLSTRTSGGTQNLDETIGIYEIDPLVPSFPVVDISFDLATVDSSQARFRGELFATFTRSNGFETQVPIWSGSQFSVLTNRGTAREFNFNTSFDLSSNQFPGSPEDYTSVTLDAYLRRISPNPGNGSFIITGGSINLSPPGNNNPDPDPKDPISPHIVYLDFDGATIDLTNHNRFSSLTGNTIWQVPAYGTTQLQEVVKTRVQDIFNDLNIEITLQQPTSGNFSTVIVGGSPEDIPHLGALGLRRNHFGFAVDPSFGTPDLNGVSYALAEKIEEQFLVGSLQHASLTDYLAQTIAHEFAHTMGLFHLEDPDNLMFASASLAPTSLTPRTPVLLLKRSEDGTVEESVWTLGQGRSIVTVDAFEYLASQVGYENGELGTMIGYTPTRLSLGQIIKRILFNTADADLFDVSVGVVSREGGLPSIIEVGDLLSGESIEFESLSMLGSFFLSAALTPGGPQDVLSIASVAEFDPQLPELEEILFSLNSTSLMADVLLYDLSSGTPKLLGNLDVHSVIPEPSAVLLLLISLTQLMLVGRNRAV